MANDVKLLLVDDNPMVLGMLQHALTPFAHVVAATDSADALLKAVDDPPDLVVCDYRMPGMDGRQLVEKLKSRPATANFSAVLMASRSDIDERLSPQDAADDYLAKPFFLKEATKRIKRTVDRIALEKMAKTAPSDGVVRGNLSQMNVIDLMQSLEMGRKSCQLKLNNEGEKCEVFFVEGQVKHATYGSLVGDQAVFKVLRWTGGNFELNFEGKTDQETTQLNTQGLLMEGLRLLDESQRDGGADAVEPSSAAPVSADTGASAAATPAAAGGGPKRRKMSSSTAEVKVPAGFSAAVVTVSDSCARGERVDASGPAVAEALAKHGFHVVAKQIVQDDSMQIQNALVHLALEVRFIVTTGGTGIAERDVTPEATEAICERVIDGIAEHMRSEGFKQTKFAPLSRGICGVRGKTLILNLPGSPSGAVESLQSVVPLVPHALNLLDGKTEHS